MARKCNPSCAFGEGHEGPCSTDPAPAEPARGATMKLELVTTELMRTCGDKADAEMFARAPKIGEPRKLRYDAHREHEALVADVLNAALAPILAEREAAILKQAAEVCGEHGRNCPRGQVLCHAADYGAILALSPADALAKHDAAVRLEEARWWDENCGFPGRNAVLREQRLVTLEAGRTP
jgi:hypothetical protein